MNKIKFIIASLVLVTVVFVGCSKKEDPQPDPIVKTVELVNPINNFVWSAMNSWYNWKDEVPNLADSKKVDINDYNAFLNLYSEPKDLFENLCYEYYKKVGPENAVDRFSGFIEDYRVQQESFRGVNDAYGFQFSLTALCEECDDVLGYVTYVVPESPAADAGMKRGDMFYKFDGTTLTRENYGVVNNYYSDEATSISLAFNTIESGVIKPTGKESTLVIRSVSENPVHYSNVITLDNGVKVGYLVYNGFKYTYHGELNSVFNDFKSQGITELVLDLRYNGGGSVLTSAYLASMIHGGASQNEVFAKLTYNDKHSDEDGAYPFYNSARIYDKVGEGFSDVSINRLNSLSRMYVITSRNTASASEMIINGLSPYLSEVILIGTTTYGKNVGSQILFDSPDFTGKSVNKNHYNAMLPIIFQIYNKLDESDYTQGFVPDYEVIEYASEIKPFGDKEEPLLKTALDLISGVSAKNTDTKDPKFLTKPIFSSLDVKKFSKEMYIIPAE